MPNSKSLLPVFAFALSLVVHPACRAAADLPPPVVAAALTRGEIPLDATGIYVQQVDSNAPLIAFNAAKPLNPASTMKLITTDAALDLLGPAYTWKTQAYTTGTLDGDVLNGDLIIKGSGDPSLVTENLWLFLRRIRDDGIREIHGNLVLDRSAFAPVPYDPAQFDGDPIKPYNAGPDALLLNYKAFALHFVPHAKAGRVDVSIDPPAAGWRVTPPRLEGGPCLDWEAALRPAPAADGIAFDGSFSAVCGDKTLYVQPYLTDDTAYFGMVFRALWSELGGSLDGTVTDGTAPPDGQPVAEWQSPPLAEVIRHINKYSNNVMARQVLLTIAEETNGGVPATTAQGAATVRNWLAAESIDTTPLVIDNGAGLSREARVSAALMGRMLLAAFRSPAMPELMSSLPLVAEDGTMRKRLIDDGVAGRAHVKTGSLQDVRAIAGYVLAASGKRYVVVCIINHPNAPAGQAAEDALLQWVYEHG